MIKIYKAIILFFSLTNITLTYAMEPKALANTCLIKIFKQLIDKHYDQELIDKLGTSTPEIQYMIKKMLIINNIDKVWPLYLNEISKATLAGHIGRVNAIAISPDTKFIVTATADRTACIWRTASYLRLMGHTDAVNCVAISSDSSFVVTGSADNTAAIWETQTGKRLTQLIGHTGSINCIAITPDHKFIVTLSSDNTVRVWGKNGICISLITTQVGRMDDLYVFSDNIILIARNDKIYHFCDFQGTCIKQFDTSQEQQCRDILPHFWKINQGFYHSRGHLGETRHFVMPTIYDISKDTAIFPLLYVANYIKNEIHISNTDGSKVYKLPLKNSHESKITVLKVSSDGSFIVSGSESDNVIYVWSIRPKIDQLLSPNISIKDLISILGLTKEPDITSTNNSTCVVS